MATLSIRNFDDEDYAQLKADARANHRSLEAEVRSRLARRRKVSREEWVERLRAARIDPGPDYPGSVAEIRAIRDEE